MISNLLFPFVKIIYVYQRFICLKSHIYIFNTFTLYSYHQEKKRIMLRLKPPGHENAIIDNYVPIFRQISKTKCHIIFIKSIPGRESSRSVEQKTSTSQKSFRACKPVVHDSYGLDFLLLNSLGIAVEKVIPFSF